MSQKFSQQLIEIIKQDKWMIGVLKIVYDLDLNDCWIGAGFVRNKVWDFKHKIERTSLNDIDVIYFNKFQTSTEADILIEEKLKAISPDINWSVKNQARMHLRNKHASYQNCLDAISYWPETATAIAIRINSENNIEYIAPYGLEDLFNLLVYPTPGFNLDTYYDRVKSKKWKEKWNNLLIYKEYKTINKFQ